MSIFKLSALQFFECISVRPSSKNIIMSIQDKFSSVPLPYHYIEVPDFDGPPIKRTKPLILFVHKVITRLTSDVFKHYGFSVMSSTASFNCSWGRQYHQKEYMACKAWQKINHFAGAFLMGRKDNFHYRMHELRSRIGDKADFYPVSFLLPEEYEQAEQIFQSHQLWIFKPSASSRGRGIHLINSSESELPISRGILQLYIDRPMLITGRKFDIRLYVLVSTISPLKIYIHDSGLGRFATHQYKAGADSNDLRMHLTNFSVNKKSEQFVACDNENEEKIEDSKWSLPFLLNYFRSIGINVDELMNTIEYVVIRTIIAGVCGIRPHHKKLIKHRHTSYEMYGLDILLDENLKPYVMEVNISPAMNGDSRLDRTIKRRLLYELYQMARFIDCDCDSRNPCPGIELYDFFCELSVDDDRIKNVENHKIKPWDNPALLDYRIARDFIEEKYIKTGFKRIFPKRKTMDDFYECFDKVEYEDIVLHDFVKMSNQERLEALDKNWEMFTNSMNEINERAQSVLEEEDLYYEEEEEEEEYEKNESTTCNI